VFVKKCPKCSPTHFCQNECVAFTVEKSNPILGATLVNCTNLPKVNNGPHWANGRKFAHSGHPSYYEDLIGWIGPNQILSWFYRFFLRHFAKCQPVTLLITFFWQNIQLQKVVATSFLRQAAGMQTNVFDLNFRTKIAMFKFHDHLSLHNLSQNRQV
jgi:hypothetical protein